jgi:hypothetical protein
MLRQKYIKGTAKQIASCIGFSVSATHLGIPTFTFAFGIGKIFLAFAKPWND